MRKKHSKLVRDKIPAIIREHGDEPITHIADRDEYWRALLNKLKEEVEELIAADGATEELADVLEVLEAIARHRGVLMNTVRRAQAAKKKTRGGFRQRVILEATA